jgi:dipeptidyl aminopeptidase/acylaminoacyl peptidase
VWSHAGDRIAYTSNARNGTDMDLYLGDGKTAAAGRLLLKRDGHWYPIEFSRDGRTLLVGKYVSINDMQLHLVDLQSGRVEALSPPAPAASYRAAVLHPDGKRAYVATDREGEYATVFEVTLGKAPKWKALTSSLPWNIDELALSGDGRQLAFVSNEEGAGKLHLLDTVAGKSRPVAGIPDGIVSGIRFARDKNVLGFTLAGAGEPGDTHLLDLKSGKRTRMTQSEVGGLDAARFRQPTLIRYPSFDDRQIPAHVYTPAGAGPHPVLVWIHGGPEAQARPYFSSLIQYLVLEAGICVVVPNVRGSDGYGKSYLLLDNGDKREDSVRDIGALLDWVQKQSELDAARVAVLGGSYGGYMVLASLVHYAERLVAGIDVVGISNFVTFLTNTKGYRRDLRRAEYGDERKPKMREFLTRISPSENAQRIKSALFVAHGANDPRVPLSETDQIVAAVRKNGRDVWYMVAKNEGHGFRKKENRDLFTTLSVLFLEKHLKAAR